MKKILITGLGSIGQRHLRNIKRVYGDSFEVIAYRTRRLQQTFSDNMTIRDGVNLEDEYDLKVFTDLDKALEEKPDAAFITNITSKHMDTALACAKAGCDLFIEKPLSDSMDNIEELKRLADEKKLKIFMGFQNRYHICIKRAKELLSKNAIGTILSVDCEFSERVTTMHSYEDYRQTYMARSDMGGGPILNLQVHDLDLLRYMFGEPIDVFSLNIKSNALDIDVESGTSSIYRFINADNNAFPVYTHTDFLQYPPAHRFKIVGECGRIEIDMNSAALKLVVDGETASNITYKDFQRNDMFIEELKDFIDCLEQSKESKIGLTDGIMSLKMALAAKKSYKENRVVKMEEIL